MLQDPGSFDGSARTTYTSLGFVEDDRAALLTKQLFAPVFHLLEEVDGFVGLLTTAAARIRTELRNDV